jgi:hypothetical protein
VKLLASRNILIAMAGLGVVFVAVVLVHSIIGSAEAMPTAERIGPPPAATGPVESLDTVLAAYRRSGNAALRRYRNSPFSAKVDSLMPVRKSGWAVSASVDGGRATVYIADREWESITPPLVPEQTRAFTCMDWQAGAAGTLTMYGCGTVATP